MTRRLSVEEEIQRPAPELFPQPPKTVVPVEHENDVSNKRAPALEGV